MPLTRLDSNTALLVIDLQKGIVSNPCVHPVPEVVSHATALLDAFRLHALPVVLVHVVGTPAGRTEQSLNSGNRSADWAELIPELKVQQGDHVIAKRARGAFSNTGLDGLLKELGVTQVVLCGIATSIGVESTARSAYDLGYNVTLAIDAITDRSIESHQHSVTRIFPRLGETGSSADVLALLDRRGS